jgi:hypothetical protein
MLSTAFCHSNHYDNFRSTGNKPTPLPYTSQSQIPASASSGNVPAAPSPTYHSQQPLLIRAQPPRIYEYSPQQGAEGDLLTISLTSEQPGLPLKIGFGSFIADTKQLHQPTYTTLTARVPAFSLTRCRELGVPLSIIAWSGDNEATDSWLVGYFIYNLGMVYFSFSPFIWLCPCVLHILLLLPAPGWKREAYFIPTQSVTPPPPLQTV